MKNLFSSLLACTFICHSITGQPPIKKLIFKGHRYEYEKEKREGEIILSTTYPYDMTKEYKQFRSDSIKVMGDSLNRQNKISPIKNKVNK